MPKKNQIYLSGNLAGDPYYEALEGGKTPYLRFELVVERDSSQMPANTKAPVDGHANKAKTERSDLLRVVMYGHRARVDFFYLQKGATVTVSGWMQSRTYLDRAIHKNRRVIEVNAQEITFGRGCNFDRGDRKRREIIEELSERGPVPPELLDEPMQLMAAEELID